MIQPIYVFPSIFLPRIIYHKSERTAYGTWTVSVCVCVSVFIDWKQKERKSLTFGYWNQSHYDVFAKREQVNFNEWWANDQSVLIYPIKQSTYT